MDPFVGSDWSDQPYVDEAAISAPPVVDPPGVDPPGVERVVEAASPVGSGTEPGHPAQHATDRRAATKASALGASADVHHRGRGILAVGVLLALVWVGHSVFSVTGATTAKSTAAQKQALHQIEHPRQATKAGTQLVEQELAGAQAYEASHQSYAGWTPPAGATAIPIGTELMFDQMVDGTCYTATLMGPQPPAVSADPTGLQCSPQEIAQREQAAQDMAAIGAERNLPALPAIGPGGAAPSRRLVGSTQAASGAMASAYPALQLSAAASLAQLIAGRDSGIFPTNLASKLLSVRVLDLTPTTAVLEVPAGSECLDIDVPSRGTPSIAQPAACA